MAHWIKAHQDDPDCPPMRTKRPAKVPRAQRPPNVQAVKYMKKRYRETGNMQPLAVVCDVLDNPKTRTGAKLHAAELAWEMTHGKIAPAQVAPAVEINQQLLQANVEVPREQLEPGQRARQLAGLLKATAVLGDVCEGHAAGQAGGGAGEPAAGGTAAPGNGAHGSGRNGA